ncbi:MAG: nuclear transport factor 2 family protein [Solirubrobacteraceae bacterium]
MRLSSWPKLKARVERTSLPEGSLQTGAAMHVVAAALTARSERRFDQFGSMLAPEIDWRGLPDENGQIPWCHGRAQALERMRPGLLRQVAVSALVEEGDRVLARVHLVDDAEPKRSERFLVAEVHDGQITRLSTYFSESEAVEALRASSAAELDQERHPPVGRDLTGRRGSPATDATVMRPADSLCPQRNIGLGLLACLPDTLVRCRGPPLFARRVHP